MATSAILRHRRALAADWTANDPVLEAGQQGFETDTLKSKLGDGVTAWTALSYASEPGGGGTVTSVDLANSTGLTASGGPIVGAGSLTYTLSANLQAWHGLATSAKTDSAVVPSTAPAAGRILVGNAGGTAYAPVAMSGDATLASTGALTIANSAITLPKMADIATDSFLGRDTAGTGAPEVLSVATAKSLLNLTGTNSGDQTSIVGITGTLAEFNTALTGADFATGGGTATGTNTGDQTITLTGDVTGSGTGSFAATLATAQPAVHTWALAQTFTVAPVFTDASGTRTALGLGTAATQNTGTSGATIPLLNAANTFSALQTFSLDLALDKAAGLNRIVAWRTGGVNRWFMQANSTAEGGSDAGSDFQLQARTDAGALIGNAITVTRSSMATTFGGVVTLSATPAVIDNSLKAATTAYVDRAAVIPIIVAVGDETTALTAGTAKVTFRMPYAATLIGVRASVNTAPTGGTLLTVDINESGTSVLSTKLTFDASEKTTTTAATPAVISDSALADDAEITIDIDTVGSTIAGAGLKVTLLVRKSA